MEPDLHKHLFTIIFLSFELIMITVWTCAFFKSRLAPIVFALILSLTLFTGYHAGLVVNIYQIVHLLLVPISSVLWLQWTFSVVRQILKDENIHIHKEKLFKVIVVSILTVGYVIIVVIRWDRIDDLYIPLIFLD